MKSPQTLSSLFSGALVLLLLAGSASADLILDDDFDGDSGGIPDGWTTSSTSDPGATFVESGTVLTVTDVRVGGGNGPALLETTSTFDPEASAKLIAEIDDLMASPAGAEPEVFVAIGINGGDALAVIFNGALFELRVALLGGPDPAYVLPGAPHLPSFSGPVRLEVDWLTDSFRVRADVDSYDSGDIPYATAFPTSSFSLPDLGTSVATGLGVNVEVADPSSATAVFDRIRVITNEVFVDGFESGDISAW